MHAGHGCSVDSFFQMLFPFREAVRGIRPAWRLSGVGVVLSVKEAVVVAHQVFVLISNTPVGEGPGLGLPIKTLLA